MWKNSLRIKFWKFIMRIICLFLILILNSCMYELSDYYDNPVNLNPTPPTISVTELDLAIDTVYVYGYHSAAFNFQSDNQEIQGVKLLIDDVVVDSVASSNGTFKFSGYSTTNGIHKLTLQVFTNSGTGSIADKLGGEGFVNSRDWVLVVDKDQSKNISYAPKDGYLQLSWKKCKSSDFVSYLVYRGNWEGELICTTQDLNFIDSSYVNQGAFYTVYVKKKDGYTIDWGSLSLAKKYSMIHLDIDDNNQYYLWWNKIPYYNAVKSLTFKLGTTTQQPTNVNDTVFKTNLHFNDYCNFTLTIEPKIKNKDYQWRSSDYNFTFSDKVGIPVKITSYWYNPLVQISKDVVACCYNDSIQKFQLSTLKFISKQELKYNGSNLYGGILSPNGKFLLACTNYPNYVAINLETNQSYLSTNITSYAGNLSQNFSISDVGTGIIKRDAGFEIAYEYVYDYKTHQGYIYHSSKYTARNILMSPNGEYYISDGTGFYKYNSNSGNVFYVEGRYEFFPYDSNKLMVLNGGVLTVYQCYPFTKLWEFNQPDVMFNIDYFNNEILCGSTNMLRIRSLSDGSIIKEIPMTITPRYSEEYFLYNHVIIYANQYAYRVK